MSPVLNTADALRVGTNAVNRVYLGSVRVWPPVVAPGGGRGDLDGWTLLADDEFTTTVVEGAFLSTYGAGTARALTWDAYPEDYLTTYGQDPPTGAGTGDHYSTDNISVVSGISGATGNCMKIRLHRGSDGLCHGAAPYPLFKDGGPTQTYGRYEFRMKCDTVAGWHPAVLKWNTREDSTGPDHIDWPESGETDFPEGTLDDTVAAYMHQYGGVTGADQDAFETATTWGAWHTYTDEWSPGLWKFYIDGVLIGTSTGSVVPPDPMRWVLQFENHNDLPQPGNPGTANVYIDYVTVWAYSPGTGGGGGSDGTYTATYGATY